MGLPAVRILTAAAAALALAGPAAHAEHTGYRGGCSFDTIDTHPTEMHGSNYYGEATALVVATDADGTPAPYPIGVTCEIWVNGVRQSSAPAVSGIGAAAGRGGLTFAAIETDVVSLCDRVTVDGEEQPLVCDDMVATQIPPQDVIDAYRTVIDAVNGYVVHYVDPALCSVLGGDLYALGEWLWDCPPYGY